MGGGLSLIKTRVNTTAETMRDYVHRQLRGLSNLKNEISRNGIFGTKLKKSQEPQKPKKSKIETLKEKFFNPNMSLNKKIDFLKQAIDSNANSTNNYVDPHIEDKKKLLYEYYYYKLKVIKIDIENIIKPYLRRIIFEKRKHKVSVNLDNKKNDDQNKAISDNNKKNDDQHNDISENNNNNEKTYKIETFIKLFMIKDNYYYNLYKFTNEFYIPFMDIKFYELFLTMTEQSIYDIFKNFSFKNLLNIYNNNNNDTEYLEILEGLKKIEEHFDKKDVVLNYNFLEKLANYYFSPLIVNRCLTPYKQLKYS